MDLLLTSTWGYSNNTSAFSAHSPPPSFQDFNHSAKGNINRTSGPPPLPDVLKASALFLLVLWTIFANLLVFIVLYKNPRLQTVPNLLVGNLAFSDFCLALIVLPLSSVYACAGEWLFNDTLCQIFVSADILCSTASIWNLSIVGLDRYWAITSPVAYLNKRNKKTACLMIITVWGFSALISLAPLLGWKQVAEHGNLVHINGSWQCTFLDLPSYTIYSATGSFFIPTLLMFFVYFKIYQAFAKHRARQIYRQKLAVSTRVIRRHIESTILHEISHILPTSDEFAKDAEDEEEVDEDGEERDGASTGNEGVLNLNVWPLKSNDGITPIVHATIYEEDEEVENQELESRLEDEEENALRDKEKAADKSEAKDQQAKVTFKKTAELPSKGAEQTKRSATVILVNSKKQWRSQEKAGNTVVDSHANLNGEKLGKSVICARKEAKMKSIESEKDVTNNGSHQSNFISSTAMPTYEKVRRHKRRKELNVRKSLQTKPRAISAAKERRGVRVLGIILGCFTLCWTPFFIMYVVVQFCGDCSINPHIEMFITWLGYSNSAMNPIIYTVFNREGRAQVRHISDLHCNDR